VRDTSQLTNFSIDGEYSSNTLSERREWLLRAFATPSNVELRVLGISRIDPRGPSSMSFGEQGSSRCARALRVASWMVSTR
jgi:hypothetical protein